MAVVLKEYSKTTSSTSLETIISAVSDAEGLRLTSIIAYNPTGGSVNVEVTINNGSSDVITLADTGLAAGNSTFLIVGTDQVNIGQNYIVKVKSSVSGIQFYASATLGVSV
jgi:hypothetical protein